MKLKAIISDVDGTLYEFRDSGGFDGSSFANLVSVNIEKFVAYELTNNDTDKARIVIEGMRLAYGEDFSLAFEKEYGVPRDKYFAATWDIDPEPYVVQNKRLSQELGSITIKRTILSAAPKIWVQRVLDILEISNQFPDGQYTAELNLRKPSVEIFRQLAKDIGVNPWQCLSIGDQPSSDIVPARLAGMRTMLVGDSTCREADYVAKTFVDGIELLKEEGLL